MIHKEVRVENVREYVQITLTGTGREQSVALDMGQLDRLILDLQEARECMAEMVAKRTYCRPGEPVGDMIKRVAEKLVGDGPKRHEDLSEDAERRARRIRRREMIERRLLRAMRRDVKIFKKIIDGKRK